LASFNQLRIVMEIVSAAVEDLQHILALQKRAYESEARLYDDWNIPPLTQSLPEIKNEFGEKVFLKAVVEGEIVGSVRAQEVDGSCYIGRLVVAPRRQGQGIGTTLMREIEQLFPGAMRFELFTGFRSERNLGLYERLGYTVFKREGMLVFLQKDNPAGKAGCELRPQ
jgi:ribosomal protein S18 acetylase RimI-like enzyme